MEFGLKVLELLQARGGLTSEETEALKKIPITTLERMLGDPEVRKALGIIRSADGVVTTIADEEAVISALKSLALEIAKKEVQVGQMMGKEDRATLVDSWTEERKPGITGEPTESHVISLTPEVIPSAPTPAPTKRYRPTSPDDRKILIPQALVLNLNAHPKIKRIFIELKKLHIETFENAVSVLLRVFLELSVDTFLTSRSVTFQEHEKLKLKMEKVATYWETTRTLTSTKLKPWRRAAGSNHLFSLNVLHSYVHSTIAIPKKRELIRTWDEMEIYFKTLWP